jgi:hypothetical protein
MYLKRNPVSIGGDNFHIDIGVHDSLGSFVKDFVNFLLMFWGDKTLEIVLHDGMRGMACDPSNSLVEKDKFSFEIDNKKYFRGIFNKRPVIFF